jgi:hypothetical protein
MQSSSAALTKKARNFQRREHEKIAHEPSLDLPSDLDGGLF